MKPPTRIPLRVASQVTNPANASALRSRTIHSTFARAANVAPIVGTGPPPEPPTPAVRAANERVERRKRHAKIFETATELRNAKGGRGAALKRRFWKDVGVEEVDGALQVHLDTRPLRHPETKQIIRLPLTKPNLASALALEWDVLTSAQQATKQHLIPLTSLVCRALDIMEDDAAAAAKNGGAEQAKIRTSIAHTVLKYLDTDSLLCWAPPASQHDLKNDEGESLRDVQKRTANEVVSYLTTHVWPGIQIDPVLDGHSIVPKQQSEGVREVVQGWISGLNAWELAGLERAVLAGKSLVAAARFVVEWSEGPVGVMPGAVGASTRSSFGVEDATKATSLEVDWQATQWGEVEDTHDVNKEDVRRQLGSVALLVSGTGKKVLV